MHQVIANRNQQQSQNGGDKQTANHHGRQRSLHLRTCGSGDRHWHKAQRSDQTGQENGAQQMRTALRDHTGGAHQIFRPVTHRIEVVDHQDTIQHRHAKQGDETYARRDAERQAPQPQRQDTANQRERHRAKDYQCIGGRLKGEEEQQQDQR